MQIGGEGTRTAPRPGYRDTISRVYGIGEAGIPQNARLGPGSHTHKRHMKEKAQTVREVKDETNSCTHNDDGLGGVKATISRRPYLLFGKVEFCRKE